MKCFLFRPVSVTVVYVHVMNSDLYDHYARRFVLTCAKFPARYPHRTVVVCNCGTANDETRAIFKPLENVTFLNHDNSGYDLGGYQAASRQCSDDLIVFFGASTYINGDGWLARMVEAFLAHGPAQYGAMGNKGDLGLGIWPHLRTTAIWMPPSLFNSYPGRVTTPGHRHPFEHGRDCFTSWVNKQGLKSWVITWDYDLPYRNWDDSPKGYQRGDQSDLIAGDHLTEPPYYPKS